jgi:thiol-disulfide isomerase/thioredoxin
MNKKQFKFFAFSTIFITLVFLGIKFYESTQVNAESKKNSELSFEKSKPAYLFSAKTINGETLELSNLKGKIVILNFWATWCPYCVEEIPHLIKLQDKYKDKVKILGITVDDADAQISVRQFVEQKKINYSILFSTKEIAKGYGPMTGIPMTIILDKNLQVAKKLMGYQNKSSLEKEIKTLL